MRMYDIIHKKRDGFPLTDEEISFVVQGCTDGSIPDYQLSALMRRSTSRGLIPMKPLSSPTGWPFGRSGGSFGDSGLQGG